MYNSRVECLREGLLRKVLFELCQRAEDDRVPAPSSESDVDAEDKPKWEKGMLAEDWLLEDGENVVEVVTSLDMVDMMGMQELSQGMLWRVHRKEEPMREEV